MVLFSTCHKEYGKKKCKFNIQVKTQVHKSIELNSYLMSLQNILELWKSDPITNKSVFFWKISAIWFSRDLHI